MTDPAADRLRFGSDDLRLPDALRGPLRAHLAALRERYRKKGWGGPVGFGARPVHANSPRASICSGDAVSSAHTPTPASPKSLAFWKKRNKETFDARHPLRGFPSLA